MEKPFKLAVSAPCALTVFAPATAQLRSILAESQRAGSITNLSGRGYAYQGQYSSKTKLAAWVPRS